MIDNLAQAHVERARAHGLTVGAYHFFRASQPIEEQLASFRKATLLTGYGRHEDIVPAVDFEDDTTARPITPEHAPLCEKLCSAFNATFLLPPILYITQRDWGRVGSPAWALRYPLWVAHYSIASRKEPATPNGQPWAIWQHRVGPLQLDGPHGYYQPATFDHNVANFLPLLSGQKLMAEDLAPPPSIPSERDRPDEDNTHLGMAELLVDTLSKDLLEEGMRSRAHDMQEAEDDEITVVEGKGQA